MNKRSCPGLAYSLNLPQKAKRRRRKVLSLRGDNHIAYADETETGNGVP